MLIWFLLFVTVVLISFILALKSMTDYYERPVKFAKDYSPFLVKKPENFTTEIINEIYEMTEENKLVIGFERLFKGSRQALVIYAPISLMEPFYDTLGLLELEDYSFRADTENPEKEAYALRAWEVGIKKKASIKATKESGLPSVSSLLDDSEEYWWQFVVQPSGGTVEETTKQLFAFVIGRTDDISPKRDNLKQAAQETYQSGKKFGNKRFHLVMRGVIQAADKKRADYLQSNFVKIGNHLGLTPLPQSYSGGQIAAHYQERALPQFGEEGVPLVLTTEEIQYLLKLPVD